MEKMGRIARGNILEKMSEDRIQFTIVGIGVSRQFTHSLRREACRWVNEVM